MKAVLSVAGGVLVLTVAILLGFFFSGQSGSTPTIQAYFTTPGHHSNPGDHSNLGDHSNPEHHSNPKKISCPSVGDPICAIVRELKQATGSVDIAMYTMTPSKKSADDSFVDSWGESARQLLLDTVHDLRQDVKVRLRLGGSNDKTKAYLQKRANLALCTGKPSPAQPDKTFKNGNDGIMHDKFLVIDRKVVITGSLNWNASSIEDNNENIVIIRDQHVAQQYEHEFDRMWRSKRCPVAPPASGRVLSRPDF